MLSLWEQQTGVPEALHPPLDRDVTADVCVVGGGFLGLWTAIRSSFRSLLLSKPPPDAYPQSGYSSPSPSACVPGNAFVI